MNKNSNLVFRKIPSLYFLYEVNENGTIIRNVKSKKHLLIKLDKHHSSIGYYATWVHGNKFPKGKRVMIHSVVAECWLGKKPDGYEIDHIDRNPHNNHYTNLRYVTKSAQMKNRDHTNISKQGSKNLELARQQRAKSVRVVNTTTNDEHIFVSYAECSRFLSNYYNINSEKIRWRLKAHRSHIFDFDVYYLNVETGHDNSTE